MKDGAGWWRKVGREGERWGPWPESGARTLEGVQGFPSASLHLCLPHPSARRPASPLQVSMRSLHTGTEPWLYLGEMCGPLAPDILILLSSPTATVRRPWEPSDSGGGGHSPNCLWVECRVTAGSSQHTPEPLTLGSGLDCMRAAPLYPQGSKATSMPLTWCLFVHVSSGGDRVCGPPGQRSLHRVLPLSSPLGLSVHEGPCVSVCAPDPTPSSWALADSGFRSPVCNWASGCQ